MEDNRKTFELAIDNIFKQIDYNETVRYFEQLLGETGTFECPICHSSNKLIQTYYVPTPYYPVIINLPIVPNGDREVSALFTIAVQCDVCGRLDLFSLSKLLDWKKQQHKDGNDEPKAN